jgi:hypothetical protein
VRILQPHLALTLLADCKAGLGLAIGAIEVLETVQIVDGANRIDRRDPNPADAESTQFERIGASAEI